MPLIPKVLFKKSVRSKLKVNWLVQFYLETAIKCGLWRWQADSRFAVPQWVEG